jgi:hypothetical protein
MVYNINQHTCVIGWWSFSWYHILHFFFMNLFVYKFS